MSRQMVVLGIKLEQQTGLIFFFFFSRMHFVRVLSKEYHVIADELNRMCVGLDNLVDSLDHIFMVSCPS